MANQVETHKASLASGDWLELEISRSSSAATQYRLRGAGCGRILEVLNSWRLKLCAGNAPEMAEIQLPIGSDHACMLMRELLQRAKGEFRFPYVEEELCHCRAVPLARVDAAVFAGCQNVDAVARETSAGTACGTCRTDTEKIIKFRLG